ncbi:MAG TPA: cytochrome c biogenesis protein ResB [Chthoniobacteraceae bacterium]|jgi:hypothetical protein|nr:hypothetical protein [Chthoniobacter sp.]HEV7867199.1 cytochrome c biogenesis protein ResB [Chthoniobacteraceae bacterium]
MNAIWKFFTSLRLTVACLGFGIILVWIGTVAQADEGLYQAQARYFKQWYVWGVTLWGNRIPILLPGGYLLGVLLIVNLVAAHIKRFEWAWKKVGIHLTHAGVVLMLIGQLFTDQFSQETQMRFSEGETRSYSASGMEYELAFISDLDAKNAEVVAVPAAMLAAGGEIRHEKLPFTIRVKEYWPNSDPSFRAPMNSKDAPLTDKGVAQHFDFKSSPEKHSMDEKNVPTAVLEFVSPAGSLGTWVAPGWAGDEAMVVALRRSYERQAGRETAVKIASQLTEPQVIEANGRKYTFSLRPTRAYKPFSVTLLKTAHDVYPGTEIPKNFSSRVRLENPGAGENREVDIYMNNPLRYEGLTFYQYQMDQDELAANRGTSTLQVVRNPSWLAPYIGCIIVGIGMTWQFLYHLAGFIRKRAAQPLPA